MTKKKQANKPSLLNKIFRFLFPEDWKAEFQRGKKIGSASELSRKAGGKLFDAGKAARKKIDPEHKMKVGKQKEKGH